MDAAIGPMAGRVCLVTGATAGIGEATALALAAQGATVVIVSRSAERCAATAARIRQETGNPAVEWLAADLSSQADIRRLAEAFRARHAQLHVLVNNAGAVFLRRETSVDGLEMTFALNHLGYFLLTDLLLPMLKASAPARIVNVSSGAHAAGRMRWDDLQAPTGFAAYAQSKLANVLFTYELARRLAGTGVTVNALHPGMVATRFGANNGRLGPLVRRLMDRFSISIEEGAETVIYLASSPEVEGVTGKYFEQKRPVASSKASYDEGDARRLWAESDRLTQSTKNTQEHEVRHL